MSVVTTGMPDSSASASSSCEASALITPPPTYSTGCLALAMSRAASRICLPCGLVTGRYPGSFISGGHEKVISAWRTSFGMSTRTAPGRPVWAMWNASAIIRGMSSPWETRKLCLVIGIVMPEMSASWKPSVPMSAVPTWPVMATMGTESICASASGVTRLVAPGPDVAMQTPTLPVAWAYPVAACPAPCSCRTSTWRTLTES